MLIRRRDKLAAKIDAIDERIRMTGLGIGQTGQPSDGPAAGRTRSALAENFSSVSVARTRPCSV